MWYKIKYTSEETLESGKVLNTVDYYLIDSDNFANAGYEVMKANAGEGEVEDVMLMKSYKPAGNIPYNKSNKLFIVKFAEDFTNENGKVKTMKYPVPFYANDSKELQTILDLYMKQGLDNMRITTISETKWKYINNEGTC